MQSLTGGRRRRGTRKGARSSRRRRGTRRSTLRRMFSRPRWMFGGQQQLQQY